MSSFLPVSLVLIVVIAFVSYKGLMDHSFYNRYCFRVAPILYSKDYKRLITSAFLHVSWMHLIFNMVALYFFSSSIEPMVGPVRFLVIFFVSVVAGDLLSLYIHKNHNSYSSAGASGAIMGVIFAAIAIVPGMSIGLFPLPISIPGWLFGLVFVAFSIYGIRSRKDNIGHDAHLGGGLAGMMVALVMYPSSLVTNIVPILIIALPCIAFILFIFYKPEALFIDNVFFKRTRNLTVEDKYNLTRKEKQQVVDDILEKIHKEGMQSLTKKERMLLKEYSEKA